jgi:hypothetical protein
MELIKSKKNCEVCTKVLEGIFWYCRNCEIFLCNNCLCNHNEHDIVALKFVKTEKAKLLPISYFGGGPSGNKWTTHNKNEFLEHLQPCPHVLNCLNSKKVVFKNESTNELLCPKCVEKDKKNLDYNILPFILLNDNETIRMVHIQFYPGINLDIIQSGPKTSSKGQNIKVHVKIKNMSIYSISNIEISLINISKKFSLINTIKKDIGPKDWYIGRHYPENFIIHKKMQINTIESKESKEIIFELRIPNDTEIKVPINNPFTIYTKIYYKTFLGDFNLIYANDLNITLLK